MGFLVLCVRGFLSVRLHPHFQKFFCFHPRWDSLYFPQTPIWFFSALGFFKAHESNQALSQMHGKFIQVRFLDDPLSLPLEPQCRLHTQGTESLLVWLGFQINESNRCDSLYIQLFSQTSTEFEISHQGLPPWLWFPRLWFSIDKCQVPLWWHVDN